MATVSGECAASVEIGKHLAASPASPPAPANSSLVTQMPPVDPAPPTPRADTSLIPRDVLFGDPSRTRARISPDGKHLSFIAPRQGVLNV